MSALLVAPAEIVLVDPDGCTSKERKLSREEAEALYEGIYPDM